MDVLELSTRNCAVHMDHYGGKRLPYTCMEAQGLWRRLIKSEAPDKGRVFEVLDASGGYASACLGAGHPIISQTLSKLIGHCGYATDELGSHERFLFLEEFFGPGGLWADRFPASEYHVSGRNSGSEGMELALRLIFENNWDLRHLRRRPDREGREVVLAFEGAWHGWTAGVQSLINRRHYRAGLPDALAEGPFGLTARFLPFGEIDLLENFFSDHGHTIAALIVEPIQGDAGIIVPPRGYLRRLAELCKQHKVLLVADEVLTFAKTGQFFAMSDDGAVETDITVIGKSLGFGTVSASLVIARRELQVRSCGAVATSDLRPLTCGLIRACMKYVAESELLDRSRVLGEKFRDQLGQVVDEFPDLFREVRGRGFLIGIELMERAAQRLPRLRQLLIEHGLYVEFMAGAGRRTHGLRFILPALRLAPPLVATESDLHEVSESIRAAAMALEGELNGF